MGNGKWDERRRTVPNLIDPEFTNLLHILRVFQIQSMLLDPFPEYRVGSTHLCSYSAVECVIRIRDIIVSPIVYQYIILPLSSISQRSTAMTDHASCQVSRVITQTSNPLPQALLRRLSSSSSSWGQYNYPISLLPYVWVVPVIGSDEGLTWNHLRPSCPFTSATSSIELDPAVESI